MIESTVVYDGSTIDWDTCEVGPFVIIGHPAVSLTAETEATAIGRGATIRSHTVIYAGNTIGEGFGTGHGVLIRESNTIGRNVNIGSHSVIEHHVEIGDYVRIHSNVFIPEFTIIEDNVAIGPCSTLTNSRYPWSADAKATLRGPHLEHDVILGANVTVLPGVRIRSRSLVGAGAVVVDDVPEGAVVVGNPARVVRQVSDIDAYRALWESEESR